MEKASTYASSTTSQAQNGREDAPFLTDNPKFQEEDHFLPINEDIPRASQQQQQQPKQRKLMLSKYTIYVTVQRMYIVGSNNRETMFRVLEIDLSQPNNEDLSIIEDNVFFTRNEIMKVLSGLEESSEGGLTKKLTAVGLLGFIRFTQNWYLAVITKKSPVSILGGHYLYHIDGTELVPVCNNYKKPDRHSEETRYLMTFANLDLSKTFYYSYTYDLTSSLQQNFLNNKKQALAPHEQIDFDYNEMFVWNSFLLKPILSLSFDRIYDWFQPIIHGFIDQAKISIFDAKIYITIIARRSHHFAGARFLKRGVNDQGNVANEVETEQIVHDLLTSPFHDPKGGFFNNPRYTSYVQHRGSIPLSWSQEIGSNIKLQTKPPININVVDPFYSAAALHFDDLFRRYGSPILILNLIKQREKTPRETKLLHMFEECVEYLNKFLPEKNKLHYTAWDMSRASKNRGQDVIEYLESYADETLKTTGFFHNGLNLKETKLQQGICRTNCIDCLDRTNAAQFIIGKRALGYQLHSLGMIDDIYLEYDSDVVNILTEMFHDHGDTILLQYGGSHLVNTMETYRKINQWTSHSRDMIESIKRFYSNSFVDAQRQEAINLFLGNYVWEKGLPMLWDLDTDYYLHHDFLGSNLKFKPSYTHWFTDSHLLDSTKLIVKYLSKYNPEELKNEFYCKKYVSYPSFYENYFAELYIPRAYVSLKDVFEFNMNSTLRYVDGLSQQPSTPTTTGSHIFNKELTAHNALGTATDKDELDHQGTLNDLTSPFETRKPQLMNIKLKNLGRKDEMKPNESPIKTTSTTSELDEFKFLKLQIAKLFKNFENEYIYFPLNLKRFLDKNTSKMLHRVLKEKENYPVFDYSVNNGNNKNVANVSGSSCFQNFNLDGFVDNNKEFHDLEDHSMSNISDNMKCYTDSVKTPRVELNDEIAYYNVINSVKNLSLWSQQKNYVSNEYIYNYNETKVSAEDFDVYSNACHLNDVGNEPDSDSHDISIGWNMLSHTDQVNDNYFSDPMGNEAPPSPPQAPWYFDQLSLSSTPPLASSMRSSVLEQPSDESGSEEEHALYEEEEGYNQFPDIQDKETGNDEQGEADHEVGEAEERAGHEELRPEETGEGDETVIHNEIESGKITFDATERDGLV